MRRRARGLADVRLGSALALGLVACGGAPNASNEDEAPIEIVIDDLGVPHVYADTDEDLFHGYGYQLATDRLLQLEMWRRFALGRRAEILGADFKGSFGATALHDDKLVRLFDLPRWGKLDAQRMREEYPERWRLVQAWRAGINRRIEGLGGDLMALEIDTIAERTGSSPSSVRRLLGRAALRLGERLGAPGGAR